jgi:hypothetical protein
MSALLHPCVPLSAPPLVHGGPCISGHGSPSVDRVHEISFTKIFPYSRLIRESSKKVSGLFGNQLVVRDFCRETPGF